MAIATQNPPPPGLPPEGEGELAKNSPPLQGEGQGGGGLNWLRVCAVDDIPCLGARVVSRTPGPNVAVFRTAVDTFFALDDKCPHRGGPLSQGIVFGDRVACPLHNMNIELPTGCAVKPDKGEVRRYDVKVDAGMVYVDLGPHAHD